MDGIFTPSADIREQVIHRGAPAPRVHVIPNGLDTGRFSLRTPEEREQARRLLGLPADATVLLHFGRDWQTKGGDLFLAAVRTMIDQLPAGSSKSIIAVSSQGGQPARELSAALGIDKQIRVIGPRDDVETLHAAADVVLSTSRAEGGDPPLAVLEALSRGIPVVASDIPGHTSAAAAEACRVVPLDASAIAAATEEVLARDPERAAREAHQGHAWVEAERAIDGWAERMVGFYTAALSRRGGASGS